MGESPTHTGSKPRHEVVPFSTHFHLRSVRIRARRVQQRSARACEAHGAFGREGAGSRVAVGGKEVLALAVGVGLRGVGAGAGVAVACEEGIRCGSGPHGVFRLFCSKRFHRVVRPWAGNGGISLEMSLNILLLHLFTGNTEGVGTGKGLFVVEVSGSGVGIGGWYRGKGAAVPLPRSRVKSYLVP